MIGEVAAAVIGGNKIIGATKNIKKNFDKVNKNFAKWNSKKSFKPKKPKQNDYEKKMMNVMGLNK